MLFLEAETATTGSSKEVDIGYILFDCGQPMPVSMLAIAISWKQYLT